MAGYNDRNGPQSNGTGNRGGEDPNEPKTWAPFLYVTAARSDAGMARARDVANALLNNGERVRARWLREAFDELGATRDKLEAEHEMRRTELMWARLLVVLTDPADVNGEHLVEWGEFARLKRPVILVAGTPDAVTLYGKRPEVVRVGSPSEVPVAVEMALRLAAMKEIGEKEALQRTGYFDKKRQQQDEERY